MSRLASFLSLVIHALDIRVIGHLTPAARRAAKTPRGPQSWRHLSRDALLPRRHHRAAHAAHARSAGFQHHLHRHQSTLIGGPKVTGWEKHSGEIVKADVSKLLPKGFLPKQLLCDGERQILARYPNFDAKDPLYGGWAFVRSFSACRSSRGPSLETHTLCEARGRRGNGRIPRTSSSTSSRNTAGGTSSSPSRRSIPPRDCSR
jgi:hypothetical protein